MIRMNFLITINIFPTVAFAETTVMRSEADAIGQLSTLVIKQGKTKDEAVKNLLDFLKSHDLHGKAKISKIIPHVFHTMKRRA